MYVNGETGLNNGGYKLDLKERCGGSHYPVECKMYFDYGHEGHLELIAGNIFLISIRWIFCCMTHFIGGVILITLGLSLLIRCADF